MATWTNIGTNLLEPGKPIRSVDGLALRDNPIAIAEGAAGAPRIQNAAIQAGAVTDDKITSVSWWKIYGRPALDAYYSTGEYSMKAGGTNSYRVPDGYVVTGVETEKIGSEGGSSSLKSIYARRLAV